MTWVTLLLLGIGVADLVASALDHPDDTEGRPRRSWLVPVLAGVTIQVFAASLGGLTGVGAWAAVALASGTVMAWRRLLEQPGFAARRTHRPLPADGAGPGRFGTRGARRTLAVLVVPLGLALALSGFAPPLGGPLAAWLAWIDVPALAAFSPGRVLLLFALALVNLVTANHVVQLVLASVGAQRPHQEPEPGSTPLDAVARRPRTWLRGGRLLGALERLLILGFGMGGHLTASGLVVAAKGLLRFPELQAAARTDVGSVDQVTEYFLVGTFTSLLVALASVMLLG